MPPAPSSMAGPAEDTLVPSSAPLKMNWSSPATFSDFPDDIVDRNHMQSKSCVRVLPNATTPTIIDAETFESACLAAARDPLSVAAQLSACASTTPSADAYVELASYCLSAPVGTIGSRRQLRVVAVSLLDEALARFPNDVLAMCAKGEALLPPLHAGSAEPDTPYPVLLEAFNHFNRAAEAGSFEGLFLRGRWLLTTSPAHKCPRMAAQGKNDLIKAATEHGLPRALVYLAHCYEFPGRISKVAFVRDLPKGRMERERHIFGLYQRAAASGLADALNDVGSSYATGYAGLPLDFDTAASFYVRAIQAGSVDALSNLGIHYESGMSGKAPERIDMAKALYYYRAGVRMRCLTCTQSLAGWYEEGIAGILEPDTHKAERLYRRALLLCEDLNDTTTASRVLKDLAALYISQLKLAAPTSADSTYYEARVQELTGDEAVAEASMVEVERAILAEVAPGNRKKRLTELLGDVYAARVAERAGELLQKERERIARRESGETGEGEEEADGAFEHVFGSASEEARKPKRSRRGRRMS